MMHTSIKINLSSSFLDKYYFIYKFNMNLNKIKFCSSLINEMFEYFHRLNRY